MYTSSHQLTQLLQQPRSWGRALVFSPEPGKMLPHDAVGKAHAYASCWAAVRESPQFAQGWVVQLVQSESEFGFLFEAPQLGLLLWPRSEKSGWIKQDSDPSKHDS